LEKTNRKRPLKRQWAPERDKTNSSITREDAHFQKKKLFTEKNDTKREIILTRGP
jgi:hypothetical protein